ncbi:hypothetical protein MBLNU457_4124t1 [Dothideomycetes sp. NU457]
MSTLAGLLSQRMPTFQTRQALIIVGLQNDFLSPDGKLPVTNGHEYLDRISTLVPAFREQGDIIWVRSEYRGDRTANGKTVDDCSVILKGPSERNDDGNEDEEADLPPEHQHLASLPGGHVPLQASTRTMEIMQRALAWARDLRLDDTTADDEEEPDQGIDEELFLIQTAQRQACCLPGSNGAEYPPEIAALQMPGDIHITKPCYSAYKQTGLLHSLRSKLITEIYIVGDMTNISVYATAIDAAQHAGSINIVGDCLGYRKIERHLEAINQLTEQTGANITSSRTLLARLRGEDVQETNAEEVSREPPPDESGHAEQSSHQTSATRMERTHNDTQSTNPTLSAATIARFIDDRQDVQQPPLESSEPRPLRVDAGRFRRASVEVPERNAQQISPSPNESSIRDDMSERPSVGQKRRSSELDVLVQEASVDANRGKSASDPMNGMKRSMSKKQKQFHSLATFGTLGPDDSIGTGDTSIICSLLPPEQAQTAFQRLLVEVPWQTMRHATGEVPRLVCCQGSTDESGCMPVYRHPSDSSLPLLHWTPAVLQVKAEAEKRVEHDLNHVLIQLYRGGTDNISEHTDKTLDIVHGSKIVNVSFGAQRTIRLRTKRAPQTELPAQVEKKDGPGMSRQTQRIHMPHNSMLSMGLDTNSKYLHGIQPDKRIQSELSAAEKAYNGLRISLTFRKIGTFITSDSKKIWGQGATGKTKEEAKPTINGDTSASDELIKAFGTENQSTSFDWQATYGNGFDVLHLKTKLPEQERPILFQCGNQSTDDEAVMLFLRYLGMEVDTVEQPAINLDFDSAEQLAAITDADGTQIPWISRQRRRQTMLRNSDNLHTQVTGVASILLYLHVRHSGETDTSQLAREIEILNSPLLDRMKGHLRLVVKGHEALDESLVQEFDEHVADYISLSTAVSADEPAFIAGPQFGVADCYLFPIREMLAEYKKHGISEISEITKKYLEDVTPAVQRLRAKGDGQ